MAEAVSGMNELATSGGRDVALFDPKQAATKDAKLDAVIDYARRVKDWETLEAAVDQKVDQIREFVGWWKDTVTVNKGGDRRSENQNNSSVILIAEDAERITGISPMQVSRWRTKLKNETAYKETLYGAAYRKFIGDKGQTDLRGASGTGENEWYTPPEHINHARSVLGEIDLDPASSESANQRVGATDIFTKEENGLEQEWHGRVWMNPPYAQPEIHQFIEKLVTEYQAGNVTEAIALTHNYTDTKWFQLAAHASSAICFTRGRIAFLSPTDEKAAPTQGQAFFYFGDNIDAFYQQFSAVGFVVEVRHGCE